jgi:hypothetical protein
MAQIYVLSLFANLLSSLALASDFWGRKATLFAAFKGIGERRKTAIPIGLATALIGVLKLIVLSPGETVPVAGDLLPGLVGAALGLLLIGGVFPKTIDGPEGSTERPRWSVLAYRVPLSIIGVLVTLVHFIVPGVLIL